MNVPAPEISRTNEKKTDDLVQLIHDHKNLVISIVRSYRPDESIFQDLVQEGILGIIKAYERFDDSMGNKFCTYASYWIRYYVRRYMSTNSRTMRVPVRKLDMCRAIAEMKESCAKCGIDAADADIACSLRLSVQALRHAEMCSQQILSFDMPMGETGTMLYELVEDIVNDHVETRLIEDELREELTSAMNMLVEKEKHIISKRFGLGCSGAVTLREIATEYGVSAETVRQIEKRAIAKLRERCSGLRAYLD